MPSLSRFVRWSLFGAYLALTILLSSMTRPPYAEAVSDTMLHAIEFAFMAILLVQALGQGLFKSHSGRHLAIALAFGVLYGAADEIHQYFTPGRHSSVKDAVVDAIATIATVALIALLGGIAGRRRAGSARTPGPAPSAEAGQGPAGDPAAPRVELLTRTGCHLCDEAMAVLEAALGPAGRGFEVIDVDASPELAARYGSEVPVVRIDGVKRFKGRVEAARLAALLADRGRLRAGSEGACVGGHGGAEARDEEPVRHGSPLASKRPYPET